MRRLTNDQFIAKASDIHNNKYSYDQINYKTSHVKIKVKCEQHGYFLVSPNNHLNGRGCPQCGFENTCKKQTYSLEEFIQKAQVVHGNKYIYSKVNYINSFVKVNIVCPVHGDFSQTPSSHLNGNGCPVCAINIRANNRRWEIKEFIEKARYVHNNKYDYSKVNYINNHTKIIIICPIHGEFDQTAGSHLSGCGCSKCKFVLLSSLKQNTKEQFIEKAKSVHGNRYDYNNVYYLSSSDKVSIGCKEHGIFNQTPNCHIQGQGCPNCKRRSKGELFIMKLLDLHKIKYIREYKIPNQIYKFRYDFYLPDYNLLIEFHGGQHFFPVEYFGGEEQFLIQKERDMFKRELAKQLKYKFLEISYKIKKKIIKEIILNIINKRIIYA